MIYKLTKSYSIFLIIMEIQIIIITSSHLIFSRLANIKMSDNNKLWGEYGAIYSVLRMQAIIVT